ncbi:MAG: FAD-dependent monooxygenase [Candidatus Sericytochromatia bacterium]|nr:FAD-dependent monooxygenase [Candidatus Tanganyikabacteria bacterium]
MTRFQIAGAGLAGSLLAVYLGQQGHQVSVFERRGDMRRESVERGRSINMALSTRGLAALREVGLEEAILERAIPMRGRMIHDRAGRTSLQPYGIHPHECIYSISRNGLNMVLLDAAAALPGVQIHFGRRAVGVDLEERTLVFPDGGEKPDPGVVIGADGAHSVVRAALARLDRFDYHQNYLDWGYKELSLPPGPGGAWRLDKHALHIWPRHDFMLIALPNLDGSFTCTLFLPFEGPGSFADLATDDAVQSFFGREFPDVVPLMPDLADDFRHNPASSLVYVRCFPWHYRDKAVLVGDACHAVVPFYGQGMNAAFEDCSVLAGILARRGAADEAAFREYEQARKENTDALADLALENFVEMRSKVARPGWVARKNLEKALARLFPGKFLPLYSMVTFSQIPYAQALRRARAQDRLLDRLFPFLRFK